MIVIRYRETCKVRQKGGKGYWTIKVNENQVCERVKFTLNNDLVSQVTLTNKILTASETVNI